MKYLNSYLRTAAVRFFPNRALVIAMLLGPMIGAMLAFGTVSAQDANVVTIDNSGRRHPGEIRPTQSRAPLGSYPFSAPQPASSDPSSIPGIVKQGSIRKKPGYPQGSIA
jgi:hypothetical protein